MRSNTNFISKGDGAAYDKVKSINNTGQTSIVCRSTMNTSRSLGSKPSHVAQH